MLEFILQYETKSWEKYNNFFVFATIVGHVNCQLACSYPIIPFPLFFVWLFLFLQKKSQTKKKGSHQPYLFTLYVYFCLYYRNVNFRGCLVYVFKQQFSVFKQHFTYFKALFHPHVFHVCWCIRHNSNPH